MNDRSATPCEVDHDTVAQMRDVNEALVISSIRQLELTEQAQKAEGKYRRLFESIDEGFCVIEKIEGQPGEPLDFRYLEANPAFEAQSGVGGVAGKTIRQAFPDASEDWFRIYDSIVKTGNPIRFEHLLDPPGRLLELYAFRVDDEVHRRVAVIFKDITARRQVEDVLAQNHAELQSHAQEVTRLNARLQAAVREKEDFIAVLSHELRTPLAPVLIAASILEQDHTLEPETRGLMQMIHRNVTQEARLIDDLLDMTRMGRGKLKLDRSPMDLRGILERSIEACRADLEAADLTLGVDIGTVPQVVDADPGRLGQVFSNLLRNAVKFTSAGGHVRVRSRCDGNLCVAEVSDSGEGIDPEFLPRAFIPFEQDDKVQPRKAGLGLGLAICKTIVELHGGEIVAESDGRGRGARFLVTLPAVAASPAQRDNQIAPSDLPRPIKPLRILLVEDDADTARVMRWLLKADGHTVHWAGNVTSALELSAAHPFDLLLSDLGLPDGSGLDLMRKLRQEGSALPGIVVSGYGQDEDLTESREAGFAAHLIKPLSPQMIRDAMFSLLG